VLAVFYRSNLVRLWLKTNPFTGEANWGHSMLVPVIGLYFLYVHREELVRANIKPSIVGLPILLAGPILFALTLVSPPFSNDYFKDLSIVFTLFGLVLFTCGWQVIRIAWFPILFLICAFPWPPLLYSRVAMPLQHLAANVAVEVMRLTGMNASQSGTKILIFNGPGNTRALNVAEACAGMRSLMTFITLGCAMAFLSARPLWQKIILIASAVPIAIFCNVMRVSGQGLLDHYWSTEWSEGFAHAFAGVVMLVPAIFLLLLVGKILDLAVIEVADPKERVAAIAAKRKTAAARPAVLARKKAKPSGEVSS
jgi:exosortase